MEAKEIRGRREQERMENRHIVKTIFDVDTWLNTTVHFVVMMKQTILKTKAIFFGGVEFLSKYHMPLRK